MHWGIHSEGLKKQYKANHAVKKNGQGQLSCLPLDTPDKLIATTDGLTLKLNNQKNRWKGVCIYHVMMKTMATIGCARCVRWHIATFTYASRGQIQKLSSWYTTTTAASVATSQMRT
jgi:hypothetical protein